MKLKKKQMKIKENINSNMKRQLLLINKWIKLFKILNISPIKLNNSLLKPKNLKVKLISIRQRRPPLQHINQQWLKDNLNSQRKLRKQHNQLVKQKNKIKIMLKIMLKVMLKAMLKVKLMQKQRERMVKKNHNQKSDILENIKKLKVYLFKV